MTERDWKIFLDVDGVLADFAGPTFRLFGRPDLLKKYPKGEYSLEAILGISTEDLWNRIDIEGANFWAHLPPYPWLARLYRGLAQLGDVYLTTKPHRSPDCYAGKRAWTARHFGTHFERLILTQHKHLLAGPRCLLIDDHEQNCQKFIDRGGHAIIFPQPWNNAVELHATPAETALALARDLIRPEPDADDFERLTDTIF